MATRKANETAETEAVTAAEAEEKEVKLEDVTEIVAKILAEAKAEAKKIVEEAKDTVAAAPNGGASKSATFKPAITEERVIVKLFKDRGQYSGDKFVGVNGVGYQIKRGVPVEVPKCVADVLSQSEEQDASTALMIDEKVTEYEKAK